MDMNLVERLKQDKKGCTLIEMIVVIVIIGILLAILIPGIVRYIDKAKEKQVMVNARSAYLDIQSLALEEYGKQGATIDTVKGKIKRDWIGGDTTDLNSGTLEGIPTSATVKGIELSDKARVTAMTYTEGSKTIVMENGTWKE